MIEKLINDLPEIYQPIYGYTKDIESSRDCLERLSIIKDIFKKLSIIKNRKLKVLDLGCAQGYFSFNLAEIGADVVGVDFCHENINLCNHLKLLHSNFKVEFIFGDIEKVVSQLNLNDFDMVLGLSVFHHLVHYKGLGATKNIIRDLSTNVDVGVFELALRDEPLYWASSQPDNPKELLSDYAFVRTILECPTHLSSISRPLVFSSNIYEYKSFKSEVREFEQFILGNKSKIYLLKDSVLKVFEDECEFELELENLNRNLDIFPDLISHSCNDSTEFWIERNIVKGETLENLLLKQKGFNKEKVLLSILDKLVYLERKSLYFNDLRTWNVVVNEDVAEFIDYSSFSEKAIDVVSPFDIYLSFFNLAREMFSGEVSKKDWDRVCELDFNSMPSKVRETFIEFLLLPKSKASFNKLNSMLLSAEKSKDIICDPLFLKIMSESIVDLQCIRNNTYKHLTQVCVNKDNKLKEKNSELKNINHSLILLEEENKEIEGKNIHLSKEIERLSIIEKQYSLFKDSKLGSGFLMIRGIQHKLYSLKKIRINFSYNLRCILNRMFSKFELSIRSNKVTADFFRKLIVKYPYILVKIHKIRNKLYGIPNSNIFRDENDEYFLELRKNIIEWKNKHERK